MGKKEVEQSAGGVGCRVGGAMVMGKEEVEQRTGVSVCGGGEGTWGLQTYSYFCNKSYLNGMFTLSLV